MADANEAKRKAMAACQEMQDLYLYIMKQTDYVGYDVELMTKIKLIDAGPEGYVEWELPITEFYSNMNKVMHGGAAGVILDMGSTAALCPIQKPGYWDFLGGVTRSLNFSYLKAIPSGTIVRIKAHVVQHGRTMALIKGSMTSVDGRTTYVTVEHHKVNVPTRPDHLSMREVMRQQKEGAKERAKL